MHRRQSLTRRKFVKESSVLATAAVVDGIFPSRTPSQQSNDFPPTFPPSHQGASPAGSAVLMNTTNGYRSVCR